jgi:TPR repeat protein
MLTSGRARVLIVVLAILAVGTIAWKAQPVRHEIAYRLAVNGYIGPARWIYHGLAREGDRLARNNYAVLIDNNRYIAADPAEKNKWFREASRYYRAAASAGLPAARYNLGMMFYDPSSKAPAMDQQWYKRAREEGDAIAQLIYARHLGPGKQDQDYRDRLALLKRLADGGDAEAQHRYGEQMYWVSETAEAERYFRLAAEQGHLEAASRLGVHLWANGGRPDEIVKWLTSAAERGDLQAQASLGDLLNEGELAPRDTRKAAYWFAMAADRTNVDEPFRRVYRLDRAGFRCCYWMRQKSDGNTRESASYELALLYLYGTGGMPKDFAKARHYFELPAKICWGESCDILKMLDAHNVPPLPKTD